MDESPKVALTADDEWAAFRIEFERVSKASKDPADMAWKLWQARAKIAEREIVFSPSYLRECFDLDPTSGVITWKRRPLNHFRNDQVWLAFNDRFEGTSPTHRRNGYLSTGLNGKTVQVHRIVWALHYGEWPTHLIDHANGVKTDNSISNLRIATYQQNSWNCRNRPNRVGLKGVTRRGDRFGTGIKYNGRHRYLGTFDTAEEAHEFWCLAADLIHGEFASHG